VILVWGLLDDPPLALVLECLERAEVPFLFLDQADTLDHDIEVEYWPSLKGTLRVSGSSYPLKDFSGLYLRPYDLRWFPEFGGLTFDSAEWGHALRFEGILWGFADMTPACVINRPACMLSNNSKPYQGEIIRRHGFLIPRTLLTTDAEAIRDQAMVWGETIYKSLSGQRSIVGRLDSTDNARLADVRWCPTQFQERIPGTDFRVHVVGGDVFVVRVESDAIDYRYQPASLERASVPEPIARRCVALAAYLGLSVAGIDLRRTPSGHWYCFEVNPSPAFSCYEQPGGPSVADAIVRLLAKQPNPILA
jgi:hypothetical protein